MGLLSGYKLNSVWSPCVSMSHRHIGWCHDQNDHNGDENGVHTESRA